MKNIVTGKEMKFLDTNTSQVFHVPSEVLMEQAAFVFIQELLLHFKPENVLVACGTGNNGGDGIAIARLLNQKGIKTKLFLLEEEIIKAGEKANSSDLYKLQKEIYSSYGYEITDTLEDSYDCVIDAIFGIGLSRDISGIYYDAISRLNLLRSTKISVDIPSGISSDNGRLLGIAFKADYTYTFSFAKLGSLLWPGSDYSGQIKILPIGITKDSLLDREFKCFSLDEDDLKLLPERVAHSNKGSYGKVLIIAGSKNMAGAAVFAAMAAYRMGAGLVKVYTHISNRDILLTSIPEVILETYDNDIEADCFKALLEWSDSIVIGPGIGINELSKKMVSYTLNNASCPTVIDADALNIISEDQTLEFNNKCDIIVTPHLGEMKRLTKRPVELIQESIVETAQDYANENNIICVLKDFHTITAIPFKETYINLSGNNGMATGGSGDVLSGIIGALAAGPLEINLAVPLAVYIHGLSGDKALPKTGLRSMMATDILDNIKEVLR